MDHLRALYTVISGLPSHCRRPPGQPRQSWTRTIETDPSALSIDLHTAWRVETSSESQSMEVAMLQHGAWPTLDDDNDVAWPADNDDDGPGLCR